MILEACAVLSAFVSFFMRRGYVEEADAGTKGIPMASRKEFFLPGFR